MWVVKGEVGIVGEDLGAKLLISRGPRCPEVEDMEERDEEGPNSPFLWSLLLLDNWEEFSLKVRSLRHCLHDF